MWLKQQKEITLNNNYDVKSSAQLALLCLKACDRFENLT